MVGVSKRNIQARRQAEAKLWTDALTADAKWEFRLSENPERNF